MVVVTITLRPRSTVVEPQTTRELWVAEGAFELFEIQRSWTRHILDNYIKAAQWGIVNRDESYHARSRIEADNRHYPVEFIHPHVCWFEIHWVENFEVGGHWEAYWIAAEDLGLNITSEDIDWHLAAQQMPYWGDQVQDDTTPSRNNTPSEASSHPSVIWIRESPAMQDIVRLAAALHIDNTPMSQTIQTTQMIQVGSINPNTGHMYTKDDIATFRTMLPDCPDCPQPFPGRGFPVCLHHNSGSCRLPGGGGGFPGGGGGGGGNSPGNPIPNIFLAPAGNPGSSKLVRNLPLILSGDHKKAKEFIIKWKKYQRANRQAAQMMVPYNRATLFLTYIQGGNMTEWVNQLGDWLELQISPTNPHWVNIYNKDLWDSIILAFNRQFADKLTQEYTLSELKAGIKMKGEELDDYIAHFEWIVHHTGLTINDKLVLNIFTTGLLYNMYKELYNIQPPLVTYEQWQHVAVNQQKRFVHLKGCQEGIKKWLEAFKTPQTNKSGPVEFQYGQRSQRNGYNTRKDSCKTCRGWRLHAWRKSVGTVDQQPCKPKSMATGK